MHLPKKIEGRKRQLQNEVFFHDGLSKEIALDAVVDENEFLVAAFKLAEHVNFVSIKIGEGHGRELVFIDPRLKGAEFKNSCHVASLYGAIMGHHPDHSNPPKAVLGERRAR